MSAESFSSEKLWISARRPHRWRSALNFSSGFTKIQIASRVIASTGFGVWTGADERATQVMELCAEKWPSCDSPELWPAASWSKPRLPLASSPVTTDTNTHRWMFSPDETSERRVVGVICVSGLIDTPGFNSHRQCWWSSHQRSVSAKLQLSHSEPKKKSVNLPVLTVNVLMCMLQSDVEKILLKCSGILSFKSKLY